MMPLWKVIETLEEMSCNPNVYSAEAIKSKMTKQAKDLCETTLEMQELAKEIYFYDT